MPNRRKFIDQRGMITPTILVILSVFLVFATSIMSWALKEKKGVEAEANETKALQVAEAGLAYYKWHLAHDEDDYRNGQTWCCVKKEGGIDVFYDELSECGGKCGPYTVPYNDYEGKAVGEYKLTLTPYPYGSNLMEVEAAGKVFKGGQTKTVVAKMGKRSLATYALLSDTNLWIGPDETIAGPVHSNSGIRFDNDCTAEVTSAVETYKCHDESCWDMFDCDFSFWDFFNEEIDSDLWDFFGAPGSGFWETFLCEGQDCEEFFSDCSNFDDMFHCVDDECALYYDSDFSAWLNAAGEDSCAGFTGPGTCESESHIEIFCIGDGCPATDKPAIELPGIWGVAPETCKARWTMGVPKIDFDLFTVDMSDIKSEAKTAGGIYLPPVLSKQQDINTAVHHGAVLGVDVAAEPGVGYRLVFKNNGTVDVYVAKSYDAASTVYYVDGDEWKFDAERIGSLGAVRNLAMPANGLIFAEDDVWVEGTVRGAATVAASTFSASKNKYARITINDNLRYTARDGRDVLGLMAEGDILVPQYAPDTLEIDAMMLSQKAHVYTRDVVFNPRLKNSLTVYGGIITYLDWTWNYATEGMVTEGYPNTLTEYDEHLTYGPPPGFPTKNSYEILSWYEK